MSLLIFLRDRGLCGHSHPHPPARYAAPPLARSPTPPQSARRREWCAPSPRRRLEVLHPGLGAAHHGSVRIGVGVSTARDARQAAVGAAAHARDELAGEAPSLAVLLASRSHTDEAADVLNAVQETVEPPALIGCVAQAIVAGRREIEDEAAVAVWLASGLAAETFQLDFVRTGSGGLLAGYQFDRSAHDLHLLLPDPYTFPSNLLIEHLNTDLPGTTVMGGVVSGGLGPGDTRLFRDREVLTSGVVGVRLPGMRRCPDRVAGLPADRLPVHRHRRGRRSDHRAGRPTAAAAPA